MIATITGWSVLGFIGCAGYWVLGMWATLTGKR
jgi:hypothetical protein